MEPNNVGSSSLEGSLWEGFQNLQTKLVSTQYTTNPNKYFMRQKSKISILTCQKETFQYSGILFYECRQLYAWKFFPLVPNN
jgi:hypothetical protein